MIESMTGTVELASIWCAAALVASVLSALLYPGFRRAIAGNRPATRSLAVLCYALMSPAVGIVIVLLNTQPEYSQMLVPEHCHDGACGDSHAPVIDTRSLGGFSLIAMASLLVFGMIAVGLYGLRLGQRRLSMLLAFGRENRKGDYLIVDSRNQLAWCCGLLRTKIVVSRGLVERLSLPQLSVVLAHERAHARRLDNLRRIVVQWATVFWPQPLKRRVRAELANDCELACDADAMRTIQNRSLFIDVIKALQMPAAIDTAAKGVAFGSSDARPRIEALMTDESAGRHPAVAYLLLVLIWFSQVGAVTGITHRVVESIGTLGM